MALVNEKMVPHKLMLFFVYGAIGCLWPFLTVHMAQLGLNKEEVAIISLVVPFTSLLGPPMAAYLGQKTNRRKAVLATCIALSGVAFTALLLVPATFRHPARLPTMEFKCESGRNSFSQIHVEKCGNECAPPREGASSLGLADCTYDCFHFKQAEALVMDDTLLHICTNFLNGTTECRVLNTTIQSNDNALTATLGNVFVEEDFCVYPFSAYTENGEISSVSCRVPQRVSCTVRCSGYPLEDDPHSMNLHQCQKVDGNPVVTFTIYLVIRMVAELFFYASLALVDASVLYGCLQHGGAFPRQFFWALVPIAFLPPIVGVIIEAFGAAYITAIDLRVIYAPAFIAFDIMAIGAVICAVVLPLHVTDYVNKFTSFAGKICGNSEASAFLFYQLALGIFFGFTETFFYWFLAELGAGTLFIGLTLTAGVLPALPLVFLGRWVICRLGHANLLIAAFFAYSIRFAGFSLMGNGAWLPWVFLFEIFEVSAMHLSWIAAMTYPEKLGPKLVTTTLISTAAIMHSNVGRGIGAFSGGYLMHYCGALTAFRVMGVASGCIGLTYMALYHFFLKPRRSPIYIESASNGHWTPMENYSNGEMHDGKPMLKGQGSNNRY